MYSEIGLLLKVLVSLLFFTSLDLFREGLRMLGVRGQVWEATVIGLGFRVFTAHCAHGDVADFRNLRALIRSLFPMRHLLLCLQIWDPNFGHHQESTT